MRHRVVLGGLGVVALVAAVVLLRDQVELPAAAPPPSLLVAPPTQTLPLEPVRQRLRWRSYPVPPGTVSARADPEHIVLTSAEPGSGRLPNLMITVRSRDGSGRETSYRPQPPGWEPVDWLILDSALFVLEVHHLPDGGELGSRLVQVDLGSGRAGQLQVHSVRSIKPSLLAVGDELIVVGLSNRAEREWCVIAVRPTTSAERTVVCGPALPTIDGADGGVIVKVPDTSPDGCSVRLLLPGHGQFGLPVYVGSCHQRQLLPLGTWQAVQLDSAGSATVPLLASDGDRQLALGSTKAPAVICHGRLYWLAGGRPDSRYGTQLRRWNPGADHVELIFRARGDTEVGWPACAGGVLSIQVLAAPSAGSQPSEVRLLDRP